MKNKSLSLGFLVAVCCAFAAHFSASAVVTGTLTNGQPDWQSAGPLAFGTDGVLFMADPRGAAVFALKTDDAKGSSTGGEFKVAAINEKIAAALGTSPQQIRIVDLAVHPGSLNAYLSVARGLGPDAAPVLIRVTGSETVEAVDLQKVWFSRAALPNAPADGEVGEGRRRSNPRLESITDIAFVDGRLIVAGLSNEEFASTLRSIPFPFDEIDQGASVEIFHGAHGRFETRSPVRTFVPYSIGGQSHVLAAYTCTPLVKFPVAELKPGAHVKGVTVAELGNRNRPLDMIVYQKGGRDFFLMANSSRGIMKISTDQLDRSEGIEQRVGGNGLAGQEYQTIDGWNQVFELAQLDAARALVVRGEPDGSLILEALPLP